MAAVAAGTVFRLLGAKDLGTSNDYRTVKMPPVNTGLLDGHLAWRQHDGGHTDGPNWRHFIQWANRLLKYTPPATADRPVPRMDQNSQTAHAQLLDKAGKGGIDVMSTIIKVNDNLEKLADGKRVRVLNINDKLADSDGRLFDGVTNPGDKLHLTIKAYQIWADALKPIFTELLGPPAKVAIQEGVGYDVDRRSGRMAE